MMSIWWWRSSSSSQDHWETPFPSWYSSWDLVFPTWIKPGNATNDRLLSDSYNTTLQHSQHYTTFSYSYLRLIYNTLQTFIWDSYIKHFNSYLILIYNTPILIWDSYTTLSNYYYTIYYTIEANNSLLYSLVLLTYPSEIQPIPIIAYGATSV